MTRETTREIDVSAVTAAVSELAVQANLYLPQGMRECVQAAEAAETTSLCKDVLRDILRNEEAAARLKVPLCQDTGLAVVFLEIGQDVHFFGGDLYAAVNKGVAAGYEKGYLRMSMVRDPLERVNTGDNTPAVIHTSIVPGDKVKITFAPKGFGSENMSAQKMFTPAAEEEDILNFIASTVKAAGSNPCPPVTVGVGIGGNFELSAFLAKKALCRPLAQRNANKRYATLEERALELINGLGIGAAGFGGTVTALYVNIEYAPTHIAGLPVAVNMGCHANRHASVVI